MKVRELRGLRPLKHQKMIETASISLLDLSRDVWRSGCQEIVWSRSADLLAPSFQSNHQFISRVGVFLCW